MANRSLEHEARSRQSHSNIREILNDHPPDSEVFGDIFQNMTFSLTFTSSQWCLFWRLLNVGCMLSDELLDLVESPNQIVRPDSAVLWNQLSSELAAQFKHDEIQCRQEKGKDSTTTG